MNLTICRFAAGIIAGALFLTGCASWEYMPKSDAEKILGGTDDAQYNSRAAELTAVIGENAANLMVLDDNTMMFYAETPESLTARISALGVKEIALPYNKEFFSAPDFQRAAAGLIKAAHQAGVQVYLQIKLSDITWKRSDNYFVRKWFNTPASQNIKLAEKLADYQHRFPEAGFDGTIFDFNVNFFTVGNAELPTGILYNWGENNYGVGRDNDLIIKQGFAAIAELKKVMPAAAKTGIRFPAEIAARADNGELSRGSLADFLAEADFVLPHIYAGSSHKFVQNFQALTENLPAEDRHRVMFLLAISGHAENNAATLRRRNFKQFTVGLQAVEDGCRKLPSFRGMAFDSFQAIEDILEKQ